jgi:hypothetical protein
MRENRLQWVLLTLAALQLTVVGAVVYDATVEGKPISSSIKALPLLLEEGRATEANWNRIEKGMTRAEVEAILGLSGDYSTGPLIFGPRSSQFLAYSPQRVGAHKPPYRKKIFGADGLADVVEWRTDQVVITVFFPPSGPLRKACIDVVRAAP